VVFDVVLPYSREAFTEAVQSNFRIGMAAAAKAGCQCEVTKSEVIITSIQAPAAAPGTRRHLSAAAGVTVGVSILMPNLQAGNLLVQSGALSKEGINKELDKLQVERVTSVSSPALSSSASNGNNNTSSGSSSGGQPVASSTVGMVVGLVVGVVVLVVTAVVAFSRFRRKKAVTPSEQSIISKIKAAAEMLGLEFRGSGAALDKYDADKLVMGHPPDAGRGINPFLNYGGGEGALLTQAGRGLAAIKEEIEKNGTEEEKECMDYVLNKEAGSSDKKFQNNWMRDCDPKTGKVLESRQVDDPDAPGGKRGKRLSDFMEHPVARFCQLTEVEVFALRFYTTAGYKGINWQDFSC
jgi:hypothetical protein